MVERVQPCSSSLLKLYTLQTLEISTRLKTWSLFLAYQFVIIMWRLSRGDFISICLFLKPHPPVFHPDGNKGQAWLHLINGSLPPPTKISRGKFTLAAMVLDMIKDGEASASKTYMGIYITTTTPEMRETSTSCVSFSKEEFNFNQVLEESLKGTSDTQGGINSWLTTLSKTWEHLTMKPHHK